LGVNELVEGLIEVSPRGCEWAALGEVGGQNGVEEGKPWSEDAAMGLGEQDGYPAPQSGQVVALRTRHTGDEAFATESSKIVRGLAVGVRLVPQAGDQLDQLAVGEAGQVVLEEHDCRQQGHDSRIAEAQGLIDRALVSRRVGPYLLQAAIAAVHAEASSAGETDWAQIVGLYDVLRRVDPSPVVALNRAAAISMRDGPEAGLTAIEAVLGQGSVGHKRGSRLT